MSTKPQISKAVLQKTTERCQGYLSELIQKSVDTYLSVLSKGSKEDFLRLLPVPRLTQNWTAEDEDALKARVRGSPEWEEFSKVTTHASGIWKICYFITGGLATDIIGLTTGLVYSSNSALAKNDHWSTTFAERIQPIIAHPFFQGSIPWIRLAIQWAVVCRTDDHRRHVFDKGCDNDVFLQILKEVYEWQQGTHRPLPCGGWPTIYTCKNSPRTARDARQSRCGVP